MNQRELDPRGGTMPYRQSLLRAAVVFLTVGLALELGAIGRNAFAVEIMAAAQVLADTTDGMLNEADSQTVPDPVGSVSADKQAGISVLGGVAHAKTGLGWIRLNAFSDSVVSPDYAVGYLDAIAVGEFVDEITVTPANPALLNQPGMATFAYHVEGFVSRGAGGSGVQAAVNSPNPGLGTTFANDFYGDAFGEYIDETREYTQNVIFGQPLELRVLMFARARVEVNGALDIATFAEVNLGNTFEWMGALEVVDQSEVEVTDYIMTSASGTNYRNAITAPADSDPLPGDYNLNGTVDAADYTVWRDMLGSLTSLPNDDTPSVGQDDYDRWKTHFGELAGSASGIGANLAVPEPTSAPLATIALLGPVFIGNCRRERL